MSVPLRTTHGPAACLLALLLALAAPAPAPAEPVYMGKVTSIPTNRKADDLFRVRIVSVNSAETSVASHIRLPVGQNLVTVELLRNRGWTRRLTKVDTQLETKTLEIEVEVGKTYLLAARVNLEADDQSQWDQTFWEPVVADVFRAR